MTIWKFHLEIVDVQKIMMPTGARILSCGNQFDDVFIWALCKNAENYEEKTIFIFGTGHEIDIDLSKHEFIGTVVTDGGNYVWHIFQPVI